MVLPLSSEHAQQKSLAVLWRRSLLLLLFLPFLLCSPRAIQLSVTAFGLRVTDVRPAQQRKDGSLC